MPDYHIRFCNRLVNSNGHTFDTCQREVTILSARDPSSAIEAAKDEFQRQEKVRDWQLRATYIECEEVKTPTF